MTIDNLRCFILVAEHLSFARAAEALYLSQPAVTKQIRALEQEVGAALFQRSTRHVELTAAGAAFYQDAKEIVARTEEALRRVRDQAQLNQSVRIGLSNSLSLSYFSRLLRAFHRDNPALYPHIEMLGYQVVRHLFLEKKLDLLFYYRENMTLKKGIRFQLLERDGWRCLVPAGHELAGRPSLQLDELSGRQLLICHPLNAPPAVAALQRRLLERRAPAQALYCNSIEIAHCMVLAGLGITLLPALLCPASAEFAAVPVADAPALSFGMFYHQDNRSEGVRRFLQGIAQGRGAADGDF